MIGIKNKKNRDWVLSVAYNSHLFDIGNELPICLSCGLSPISAHIWGDWVWTEFPKFCLGDWEVLDETEN